MKMPDQELLFDESGRIADCERIVCGAVKVSRKGSVKDSFFFGEIVKNPDKIDWLFADGTQKVYLYDQNGNRFEGCYIVEKV